MTKKIHKFALIGTSCVGKTTLLYPLNKKIEKRYKHAKVIIVEEAARTYFMQKKVRKTNFLTLHQQRIQQLAYFLEREAHNKNPDIILTDRSVLDAVAYVATAEGYKNAKKLFVKMAEWLTTYNHFFLLDPSDIPYKTDSIRQEKNDLRNAFHQSFLDILEKTNLPYTVISGHKQKRIETITRIIDQHIK